jgi:hypothetical protein
MSYGQNVSIDHPSNVCKNNSANLTVRSDQEITFYIEESIDGGTNWTIFGGRQRTTLSGSDYTYSTGSLITVSSMYRVWYSTNQSFQSSNPTLYVTNRSSEITINLFPTPIVTSFVSNQFCSGTQFIINPSVGDGAGNTVSSTFKWRTDTDSVSRILWYNGSSSDVSRVQTSTVDTTATTTKAFITEDKAYKN